jgi:KDO2-lipid IV(A) lauroyltransferase
MAIMIYRLMRTIVLVMSYIPLRIGQFLGRMLGVVFAMIPIKRTAESLDHIQQSFGNSMSRAEAKKLNRRVIMHFAQMLFEVPHIMKLSPRNLSKYVVFDNEENLLRALEKGKGVFILTGHFGNWELMAGAMAVRFGAGLAVVARPIDFQPLDLLMNELRSRFGTEIIMKQRGMRRVLAKIKENKVVGILLDQNVDWYDGVFVKFLGRWACTNKGLALLALRTDTPVIPVFSVREEDGRYRIIFENEIRLIKTGDRTKDVEENTARFTNIIDKYVRAHPDHWFWFHRRWKTRPCCSLPDAFYLS